MNYRDFCLLRDRIRAHILQMREVEESHVVGLVSGVTHGSGVISTFEIWHCPGGDELQAKLRFQLNRSGGINILQPEGRDWVARMGAGSLANPDLVFQSAMQVIDRESEPHLLHSLEEEFFSRAPTT